MTERTLAASPHLDDGLHQQSPPSTQVCIYIYIIFFEMISLNLR
jgi:hypothetical protein